MTRKRLGLVVLACLCVVLAYIGYQEYEERRQEAAAREKHAQLKRAVQAERELAQRLPHGDRDMERVPAQYPRTVSAWQAAEKTFYERILTKGRFDALVVPFQVQDHAFARDIRSLMTAELALAMTGKSTVPDPYLVARALGDGQRRFDMAEVFRIANALEVKRVVLGYVGHNAKGEMRLTMTYYDRGPKEFLGAHLLPTKGKAGNVVPNPKLRSRHFEKLAYSDVDTPIDVFYRTLPAVLEFLGLDASSASPSQSASAFDEAALPASPKDIGTGEPHAARDAYYFQLLAALAPASAERLRERLTEKSMSAIRRMSAESPDYRAVKARALMNMGLRAAALRALGTPQSAEEKHLAGMLSGNLPDVMAARPLIGPGVRALIAALEENAMAGAYRVRTQSASLAQVAALKLPGEVWQSLVARAMTDWDLWAQHENIFVKALLDRDFPLEGSTAQSLVQGASVVGDFVKLQSAADLSVLDHVRRHLAGSAEKSCCEPLNARPAAHDYLDLIEAIGTDNLLRRASFLAHTQGRPEDAQQFLARIERVYKDHPQFAVLAAQTQLALARNAHGAEREGLHRMAQATHMNVWYWEQAQTRTAAAALDDFVATGGRHLYGVDDNFYANDYPFRPFYPYWHQPDTRDAWMRNARVALANSAYDFTPMDRIQGLLSQVQNGWDDFDQVLKSVEQRFVGHPRRVKMMAQASLRRGDLQASESHYREGIRVLPEDDELYSELGALLFENGETQKSFEVFMSYPGLKKRGQVHPVSLANYAAEAGSRYWWIGDFKRAIPLYRTAAELNTGSDSSITGRMRLHLVDGDLMGALQGSFERARRYNLPYAYRDYFGQLHAMGQSQQAWEGFKAVVGVDAPQVWESALVGHRREGVSEAQIVAWMAQEPMRTAGNRHYLGAAYLLRAGVTDRMPTAELPALIAAAEGPGAAHPSTPNPPLGLPKKSPHVYMAEAHRALRKEQFAAARTVLQEATAHYDPKIRAVGHLLPYYAFAAARANDTAAVDALLETLAPADRRFDYHLAKTVLAACAGKHDQAIQHANTALRRRPFTDYRPIYPEYQFAEICEWLFEATREPRYRAIALDWARKNQTLQPWVAWAYAVEAKLATNPQERRRAIAMTHYLDRGSERLSRLPQSEVKAALKEYAIRNPFLRTNSERPKERA
jgi:tetratricopeptide (TPR) repeat protein